MAVAPQQARRLSRAIEERHVDRPERCRAERATMLKLESNVLRVRDKVLVHDSSDARMRVLAGGRHHRRDDEAHQRHRHPSVGQGRRPHHGSARSTERAPGSAEPDRVVLAVRRIRSTGSGAGSVAAAPDPALGTTIHEQENS